MTKEAVGINDIAYKKMFARTCRLSVAGVLEQSEES